MATFSLFGPQRVISSWSCPGPRCAALMKGSSLALESPHQSGWCPPSLLKRLISNETDSLNRKDVSEMARSNKPVISHVSLSVASSEATKAKLTFEEQLHSLSMKHLCHFYFRHSKHPNPNQFTIMENVVKERIESYLLDLETSPKGPVDQGQGQRNSISSTNHLDSKDCLRLLVASAQFRNPNMQLLNLIAEIMGLQAISLNASECSTLALELGRHGVLNPSALARITTTFCLRISSALPTDLSKMAVALSVLKLRDLNLFERLAGAAEPMLHLFSARELSTFLAALAVIGCPSEALLFASKDVLTGLIPRMTGDQCGLIAFSFARQNLIIPEPIRALRKRLPHVANELNSKQLSDLLISTSKLGIRHAALTSIFSTHIIFSDLDSVSLSRCILAFAELNIAQFQIWDALLNIWSARVTNERGVTSLPRDDGLANLRDITLNGTIIESSLSHAEMSNLREHGTNNGRTPPAREEIDRNHEKVPSVVQQLIGALARPFSGDKPVMGVAISKSIANMHSGDSKGLFHKEAKSWDDAVDSEEEAFMGGEVFSRKTDHIVPVLTRITVLRAIGLLLEYNASVLDLTNIGKVVRQTSRRLSQNCSRFDGSQIDQLLTALRTIPLEWLRDSTAGSAMYSSEPSSLEVELVERVAALFDSQLDANERLSSFYSLVCLYETPEDKSKVPPNYPPLFQTLARSLCDALRNAGEEIMILDLLQQHASAGLIEAKLNRLHVWTVPGASNVEPHMNSSPYNQTGAPTNWLNEPQTCVLYTISCSAALVDDLSRVLWHQLKLPHQINYKEGPYILTAVEMDMPIAYVVLSPEHYLTIPSEGNDQAEHTNLLPQRGYIDWLRPSAKLILTFATLRGWQCICISYFVWKNLKTNEAKKCFLDGQRNSAVARLHSCNTQVWCEASKNRPPELVDSYSPNGRLSIHR